MNARYLYDLWLNYDSIYIGLRELARIPACFLYLDSRQVIRDWMNPSSNSGVITTALLGLALGCPECVLHTRNNNGSKALLENDS